MCGSAELYLICGRWWVPGAAVPSPGDCLSERCDCPRWVWNSTHTWTQKRYVSAGEIILFSSFTVSVLFRFSSHLPLQHLHTHMQEAFIVQRLLFHSWRELMGKSHKKKKHPGLNSLQKEQIFCLKDLKPVSGILTFFSLFSWKLRTFSPFRLLSY